ncbi:endonuclease/exonuclease/phosphatase family protein [Nocardioides marmoribigeumensis]|uniref:Endonuclease/exonuclease/phosphatase family metal-dependent hydrolase n=1 Tax=Nocardioides marmoribigeumensis TaxID=433649 RepID=A0ABU2BXH2_9ACTN|nr:endonuclease/exonuclease/phosphatase family protein [Nocardioides marmoribigeumensis]MDR7363100.1 endonuclease/exonuclease/phosphatase family metal-dependent hydrolase [Nocardioides marmoribigeumensis]
MAAAREVGLGARTRDGRRRSRRLVATAVVGAAAFAGGLSLQGAPADAVAPRAASSLRDATPATFRVSSFNVLGASHTAPGGNKARMASGETRMQWTTQLLANNRVDVVGMQEMQPSQQAAFRQIQGDSWNLYPAGRLNRMDGHNSIAWRTDTWELVEANTIAIPYFHGVKVQMPYILLRNIASNRLVWFANFHNPANTKFAGINLQWRAQARIIEVGLANKLWETGVPLIYTGDMNETTPYFCALTTGSPMKSASGGSWGTSTCSPPPRLKIDWIFGSHDVRFANYRVNDGTLVDKASDHPMILADVTVSSRPRS